MSDVALEKHYSIADVSALWNVSKDTVRRIFADLPGVLKIRQASNKRKRKYVTLRIPEKIVTQQHAKLQGGIR